MIIFGSRTSTKLVAALIFACALCHATAAQRLFRVQTWFTLFFLPIFPFGHGRYALQCAYCGSTTNLAREAADQFIADAEAADIARVADQMIASEDAAVASSAISAPPPPPSPADRIGG